MAIDGGSVVYHVSIDSSGLVSGATQASGALQHLEADIEVTSDALNANGQAVEDQAIKFASAAKIISEIVDLVKKFASEMYSVSKQIVETGASFEQSMAQVAATSGMSASDVSHNIQAYADLSEAAREAGETTMFTATQAGEALNYLALAGYSVEESIATMPDILTIAAAGAMELGTASDMVTDAMRALSLEVDQTGVFIDKMAKTAQSSNTNVEQLGRAILTVGGTAQVLSGGVTELDTALGLMANSGIKAAQGGTSLRQILLNLTDPTNKAKQKMEELGLEVFDAEGNMRSLQDIFKDLGDIMSDFSDEQRMNALGEIFNARHIRAAVALMNSAGEEWGELAGKIENADGAAEKMADTMMSTFKGAIITAKSTLESIQITLNEGLRPILTNIVNEAIPKLRELNDTLGSPEVQANLQRLGEALERVASTLLDKIIAVIPNFIEWLSNIETHLQSLYTILVTIIGLNIALHAKQVAASMLQLVGTLVANPWLIVVAAVAALVVALNEATAAADAQREATVAAIQAENDAFKEQRDEINAAVDEWEAYKETANEVTDNAEDQRDKVQALYDEYKRLHDAGQDTTVAMQALADEIPGLSQYLDDGKDHFDDITTSVSNYCDELIRAAQLEAGKEAFVQATETANQLEGTVEQVRQEWLDSAEAYKTAKQNARDYFNSIGGSYYDWSKDQQKHYQDLLNIEKAAENIFLENNKTYNEANDAYDEAVKTREESEQAYTDLMREQAHDRGELLIGEAEGARAAGKAYAEAQKKALKQSQQEVADAKEDLLAEWKSMDTEIKSGLMTESEKWDIIDLWFKENPDWDKHDADLADWFDKKNKYFKKQADAAEAERQRIAKEQADAEAKAQREAEQRDRDWVNSIKDAWSDIEWNASMSDVNDKDLASARRKFLKDNKAFYDSHTDQKRDFIKEIAKLDKSWIEDEDTTLKEIEDKLDEFKDFYGEDSPIYQSFLTAFEKRKTDTLKKNATDMFDNWKEGYENMLKEAQDAYKKIQTSRQKFIDNLVGDIGLTVKKTQQVWNTASHSWKDETVEVFDPNQYKDALKRLQELERVTEQLKAKGLSDDIISQIWGLDPDKALETANMLNKENKETLTQFSEDRDKYYKAAEEKADKFYSDEVAKFEEQYVTPLQNYVKNGATQLKDNMGLIGEETIQGWIDGMMDKYGESEDAVGKFGTDAISTLKDALGIASPSKEFFAIGEFSIQGFIDGLKSKMESIATIFTSLGQLAGDSFINAFKSAWDNFVSLLSTTGGLQVPVSMTTTAFGMPVSQGAQVTYTGTGTSVYGLTKDDVVSAIKEAVPDGDVILKVGENDFAKISRSSLNNLAIQEGSMGLNV